MKKSQTETLKKHVKDVQERQKKLKSGSMPPKTAVKKSLSPVSKGKDKRNTKKT